MDILRGVPLEQMDCLHSNIRGFSPLVIVESDHGERFGFELSLLVMTFESEILVRIVEACAENGLYLDDDYWSSAYRAHSRIPESSNRPVSIERLTTRRVDRRPLGWRQQQATPVTGRRPSRYARPMCGRYASTLPPEAIARLFHTVNPVPNLPPSWNVAPTQDALVVRLAYTPLHQLSEENGSSGAGFLPDLVWKSRRYFRGAPRSPSLGARAGGGSWRSYSSTRQFTCSRPTYCGQARGDEELRQRFFP
jgi:hypothetical protein